MSITIPMVFLDGIGCNRINQFLLKLGLNSELFSN